jgi:DNA-binding XRE family transcriptional regulator
MSLQQHLEEALERTPHSPDPVHAAARNLVEAVVDAKDPLRPYVAHAVLRLADVLANPEAPAIPATYASVLSSEVRTARRARKLSQQEAASELGISQPALSRIEAGKLQPGEGTAGRLQTWCNGRFS